MIRTEHLAKSFGKIQALQDLTMEIPDEQVFGLIGTNGAGKSTLLRLIAGIYLPDKGSVTIDGKDVFDNPEAQKNLFFIPDDPYFFPNANAENMLSYYTSVYPRYNAERFRTLMRDFGLDEKRRISGYSKGMKKQLAVILGICSGTKYLLCDETFDGLDPVMRQAVKSLFAGDMFERGLTPVIASHNLRELEDICEHVGLLHKGGLLLSEDLENMKLGVQKVQVVFRDDGEAERAFSGLHILSREKRGKMYTVIVRGEREETDRFFRGLETVFYEILPLTLEEIFISETEVAGYDIRKLILG